MMKWKWQQEQNTQAQHQQPENPQLILSLVKWSLEEVCQVGHDSIYKPSLIKAGLASVYKNLQRTLRFLILSIKKLSVKGWDGSH